MLPKSRPTATEIKQCLSYAAAICCTLVAAIGLCGMAVPASSVALLPHFTTQPAITGNARQGETLTVTSWFWSDSRAYSYQWLRCNTSGESCVPIAGATAKTYLLLVEDVGHELRVQRTVDDFTGHPHIQRSAATAVVLPATPANTVVTIAPPTPVVLERRPVTITRRGVAPIEVSCPAGAPQGCTGTITVRLPARHAKRASAIAAQCGRGCRPLGTAKYEARAGKKVRVRVHIASAGRRLLARRKTLRVSVVATSVSGVNSATTSLTTTLRAAG